MFSSSFEPSQRSYARSSIVMASVSTFQDHKATPAARVAARKCFSCQTGMDTSSEDIRPCFLLLSRRCLSARRGPRVRHFVDGRHDDTGRSLMDHVAGSGNAVKLALEDVAVQPGRLRIDVNQSVFVTCDDDQGHLQICVFVAVVKCIWNYKCRLRC